MDAWSKAVRAYATQAAVDGKVWTGYKLVAAPTKRRYGDEEAVANAVIAAGYEPYEQKLLSMTALKRIMGERRFEEVVGEFLVRPEGKPVLVME